MCQIFPIKQQTRQAVNEAIRHFAEYNYCVMHCFFFNYPPKKWMFFLPVFCHVIYVILIDMTEGGTLSKPIAGFLLQVGVWTSTTSERFIDCSLQVPCPTLDSLFDVDCYSEAPALQGLRDLMLQGSNVTVMPALFCTDNYLLINLLISIPTDRFQWWHLYPHEMNMWVAGFYFYSLVFPTLVLWGSHKCSYTLLNWKIMMQKAACVPLRGKITLLFWVCPQGDCGGGQIVVLRVVCGGERRCGRGVCRSLLIWVSREQYGLEKERERERDTPRCGWDILWMHPMFYSTSKEAKIDPVFPCSPEWCCRLNTQG